MLYHYYCKSVVILLYHFDWTLLKATNLKLSIHSDGRLLVFNRKARLVNI